MSNDAKHNQEGSEGDEADSKLFSATWGHYENLARLMNDVANKKRFFPGELSALMLKTEIAATEKVDGSNLAMWVRFNAGLGDDPKDSSNWNVLLLQGRSAALWKKAGFEINPEEEGEGNGDDDDDEKEQEQQQVPREKLRAQAQDDLKKLTSLPGYGNAGSLGNLIPKMRDFCVRVANALGVDEIEVFGEAFRAKKIVTHANAKKEVKKFEQAATRASWHPFGFKLPPAALAAADQKQTEAKICKVNRLTSFTHKLFSSCVDFSAFPESSTSSLPTNHAEFMNLLNDPNLKDFIVCPPPLYVSKSNITDAILNTLGPLLLGATERDFEGVFLVHEEGSFGCKFKTGSHDEQGKLPSVSDLGICDDDDDVENGASASSAGEAEIKKNSEGESATGPAPIKDKKIKAAFETMLKIYKTKIAADTSLVKSKPPADPALASAKAIDQKIAADVEKATLREFSKRLSFTHIDRGQRQPIIDALVAPVVKEVMEIYIESDEPMPFTEAQLTAKAPNLIKSLVLKVPFQAPENDSDSPIEFGDVRFEFHDK
jgi:hypothetical protein